jgi:hypothetical protein
MFADVANRVAANRNQWYVAISRGRKRVTVFTENKVELRAAVIRSGQKDLALDLKTEPAASVPSEIQRPEESWTHRSLDYGERYRRHHAFIAQQQHQVQQIRI